MTSLDLILTLAAAIQGVASVPSAMIASPRVIDRLPCQGLDDEIVVCARRRETEPYRIPARLRQEPLTSPHYSWTARARDEQSAAAYDNQIVGPGAAFNRSRQTDCAWRAERLELAGRMIDCTVHVSPGTGQ